MYSLYTDEQSVAGREEEGSDGGGGDAIHFGATPTSRALLEARKSESAAMRFIGRGDRRKDTAQR